MTKRWQDLLAQTVPDIMTKLGTKGHVSQHPGSVSGQGRGNRLGSMTLTQRRRLKSGAMVEARLDLHGDTVDEACQRMQTFITTMLRAQQRYGLVVHGKGLHSARGPVLKQAITALLSGHAQVTAYESAQLKHGGAGATYFLLRQK